MWTKRRGSQCLRQILSDKEKAKVKKGYIIILVIVLLVIILAGGIIGRYNKMRV